MLFISNVASYNSLTLGHAYATLTLNRIIVQAHIRISLYASEMQFSVKSFLNTALIGFAERF